MVLVLFSLLLASEHTVDENDGSLTITVNRERGGAGAVSVSYEIEPLTAGNLDYSAIRWNAKLGRRREGR